jgi:TetR/AcrR family transcriptional regulator, transcriptional repressor for nem operon
MPVTKIEKEDLLIKCWEVFHRHGYHATSISMLAEATGLGKSGLLHHFQSKENLMKSVLDFSRIAFRNYVLKVANEDLPISERLEKLLRRQGKLAKIDRRGCFFANTALETGRDEAFKKVIEDMFEEWEVAIASIFESEMGKEKARDFAYRLILEYEGAITFYKFSGDEKHIELFIERSVAPFKK